MVKKVRRFDGFEWRNERGRRVLKLDDDTGRASCVRLHATASDLEDVIEACRQAITEMEGDDGN